MFGLALAPMAVAADALTKGVRGAIPTVAPANTALPVISGSAVVGDTLECSSGSWSGSPTSYGYQWRRGGTAIPGATAASYALVSGDAGTTITCTVTATNAAGATAATSAGVSVIAAPTLPAVTGAFAYYDAGSAANPGTRYSEDFLPAAVNTVTGALTLNNPGFGAFTTFAYICGNSVEFVPGPGGGTVPAEWSDTSREYFLAPTGDGVSYYVHGNPVGDDWSRIPGALESDSPQYPAQNFVSGVNRIIPTTQGSGTITVRSKAAKLLSSLANLIAGKPYTTDAIAPANKHSYFEVMTDGDGDAYIRSRRLARALTTGYGSEYLAHGKTYTQGPADQRYAARSEVANKRMIMWAAVLRTQMTDDRIVARSTILAANVNVSTDTFSQVAGVGALTMSLVTGEPANVRALVGATLPAPLDAGTVYYPRTSGTGFTLHPTAADATGNTNKIDITTQGTGAIQFYQLSVPGPIERMSFPLEWLDPASGQNVLTPRFNASPSASGDVIQVIVTDFVIAGTNNGDCGFSGRNARAAGDGEAIRLDIPPGSVGPIVQATGLPLPSGTYWISLKPASTALYRMHYTKAAADAAYGVATGSLSGANACIKFSAAGSGRCKVEGVKRSWNAGVPGTDIFVSPNKWSPPADQKVSIIHLYDTNNPAKSYPWMRVYCNGVLVDEYEVTTVAKGLTGAALNDGTAAWTWLNSAASHVTWQGELHAMMLAAADVIPESDLIGSGSLSAFLAATKHIQ